MNSRKKAKVPAKEAKRTTNARNRRILSFFLASLILFLLGIGALVFFWGYIPVSSLRWVAMPELKERMKEVCGDPYQFYPPTSLDWPFPLYSPDDQYYVDINDAKFRRAKEIRLSYADTNRQIGRYSYSNLIVYCWAEDSSGIYVSDYDPGDSSLFIPFSRAGKIGPLKKLLIP